MILDVTAGNRMMWKNKNPHNVVFVDKETRLRIPPDLFCDNRYLPFRDNCFGCVIFDPPHASKGPNSGLFSDPRSGSYYGLGITRKELLYNLLYAPRELFRVSKRVCFKWSWNPKMGKSRGRTIENVLWFFREYKLIYKRTWRKKTTESGWFTFVCTKSILCDSEEK